MLLIRKGNEPGSLTAYRKTPFAYYDGCNKEDIRRHLLREQGGLCAYCMRRIRLDTTKIEHWKPESKLSETEKLEYSNMLGVCYGHIEGQSGQDDTCDAKKGNCSIILDPRCPEHIETIFYEKGTGLIHSTDQQLEYDIQHNLNLNSQAHYLPQNRHAVLIAAIMQMNNRYATGTWSRQTVQKILRIYSTPDKNGELKEYAGIVIWYFSRKA